MAEPLCPAAVQRSPLQTRTIQPLHQKTRRHERLISIDFWPGNQDRAKSEIRRPNLSNPESEKTHQKSTRDCPRGKALLADKSNPWPMTYAALVRCVVDVAVKMTDPGIMTCRKMSQRAPRALANDLSVPSILYVLSTSLFMTEKDMNWMDDEIVRFAYSYTSTSSFNWVFITEK